MRTEPSRHAAAIDPRAEAAPVAIRPATADDFDACAAIINDYVDETDWLPRVHSHEAVRGIFNDELLATRTVLVAEDEGEVVAYMSASPEGFVYAIYLDASARGRGIGKALIETAKYMHPSQLELTVFEKNQAALRFYRREGFREVPEGRSTDRPEGIPTLLMRWRGAA